MKLRFKWKCLQENASSGHPVVQRTRRLWHFKWPIATKKCPKSVQRLWQIAPKLWQSLKSLKIAVPNRASSPTLSKEIALDGCFSPLKVSGWTAPGVSTHRKDEKKETKKKLKRNWKVEVILLIVTSRERIWTSNWFGASAWWHATAFQQTRSHDRRWDFAALAPKSVHNLV